jgi:hypothetical protein
MRWHHMGKVLILAGMLILAVCGAAAADGLRNIASVTATAYFNGKPPTYFWSGSLPP